MLQAMELDWRAGALIGKAIPWPFEERPWRRLASWFLEWTIMRFPSRAVVVAERVFWVFFSRLWPSFSPPQWPKFTPSLTPRARSVHPISRHS